MFIKSCLIASTLLASIALATDEPVVNNDTTAEPAQTSSMHQAEPAQINADHKNEVKPAKKKSKALKKKSKKAKHAKHAKHADNHAAHAEEHAVHAAPVEHTETKPAQ